MMGTIVIDERIYPIHSFALGEGAILAGIRLSAAEATRIPGAGGFDWSLHASDGTFVCRGRYPEIPWWPVKLRNDDSVELTLRLDIEGKVAYPTGAHL
jgi:hypothetical protein